MDRRYRQVILEINGQALAHSFNETEEAWRIALDWLAEQQRLAIPHLGVADHIAIRVN